MPERRLENFLSSVVAGLVSAALVAGVAAIWSDHFIQERLVKLLGGDITRWEDASNGKIPGGAVVAGHYGNGQELYVCRVWRDGGWHPGKIRADFGVCVFAHKRERQEDKTYQVLTSVIDRDLR